MPNPNSQPTVLGATTYFRYSTSSALNTVVAPASNTKGILVTMAQPHAIGDGFLRIMSKSSAPSSATDTAARTLAVVLYTGAGGYSSVNVVAFPYVIPAGEGLYEQASSAGNSSGASLSYTVL